MAAEWRTVSLGSLVAPGRCISYGIVQPGQSVPDGIPIVRVGDIRDGRISTVERFRVSRKIEAAYSRTRLQGGELLLTVVGTVGEAAVVPPSLAGWNTARAVAVVPVRDDVGAPWVRLALRLPQVRHVIESRLNTTVQPTLNLRDVADLPVILPPPDERQAILRVVAALEDKIDLNRRLSHTLQALSGTLFRSWFVDFDPVIAKAESRQPSELAPDFAALFPDGFQESTLGAIPEGWTCVPLEAIARNPREQVDPSEVDPATPYVSLEHIPRRSLVLEQWDRAEAASSGKFRFSKGQILFGKLRPYFHKVVPAIISGVCSTDILIIEPKRPHWYGLLLGHLFSDEFVAYADAGASGTRMPRANWEHMKRYPIALPPEPIAAAFSDFVRVAVETFEARVRESQTLAALRDLLLPKLLSGEIRIRDAEKLAVDAGA